MPGRQPKVSRLGFELPSHPDTCKTSTGTPCWICDEPGRESVTADDPHRSTATKIVRRRIRSRRQGKGQYGVCRWDERNSLVGYRKGLHRFLNRIAIFGFLSLENEVNSENVEVGVQVHRGSAERTAGFGAENRICFPSCGSRTTITLRAAEGGLELRRQHGAPSRLSNRCPLPRLRSISQLGPFC